MPVKYKYGITVGLEIHKNWNNFNWKLPELLQAYIFSRLGITICKTEEKVTAPFFYSIDNKKYIDTPTMQSKPVYHLRNGNVTILPFCRLSSIIYY